MTDPVVEVNLIGHLLRGYTTGNNDINQVVEITGATPMVGELTSRLFRAFQEVDLPMGKEVGPAAWAKFAQVPLEPVAQMCAAVPSSAFTMEAAREVAEVAATRDAKRICADIQSSTLDAEDLLQSAVMKLELVQERLHRSRTGFREDSMADHYEEFLKDQENPESARVIPCMIPQVNFAMKGGAKPGNLVIVAGRPGMGKSAFGMGWGEYAATRGRVLVYSLEMSRAEFFERYQLRGTDAKSGMEYWRRRDIHVVDNLRDTSIEGIVRDVNRRVAAARDSGKTIDLVMIDHLGLLSPSAHLKNRNRENEVSHMTRECKRLAKSMDLAVVLLAQLNREIEKRDNKTPRLSDLRESGSIEQDADVVIGLYRPSYYKTEDALVADQVCLMKVRQGQPQVVLAKFHPEQCEWRPFINLPTEF